jgi:hypothetical protein
MTDKESRWLITAIVLFSISLLLLTCLRWKHELEHHGDDEPIIRHDTTYINLIDTIHDTLPPIIKTRWLRDTIYLAKDTNGYEHNVILPITQNHYKKDGLYEAWVSGYNPMLDSIHVLRQKDIVTITNEKTIVQNKWKLYVEGGFFAHSGNFLPSVGVCIGMPKKWSCSGNISIPYKGSPIYSISIGYDLLNK